MNKITEESARGKFIVYLVTYFIFKKLLILDPGCLEAF